jgi:hypothetical protein
MAEHDHGQALDAFCVGPTALNFAYHRFYGNARANRITTSCNSRYSTHTYSRLLPRPASTVYNILPFRRYRTYIRRASDRRRCCAINCESGDLPSLSKTGWWNCAFRQQMTFCRNTWTTIVRAEVSG